MPHLLAEFTEENVKTQHLWVVKLLSLSQISTKYLQEPLHVFF